MKPCKPDVRLPVFRQQMLYADATRCRLAEIKGWLEPKRCVCLLIKDKALLQRTVSAYLRPVQWWLKQVSIGRSASVSRPRMPLPSNSPAAGQSRRLAEGIKGARGADWSHAFAPRSHPDRTSHVAGAAVCGACSASTQLPCRPGSGRARTITGRSSGRDSEHKCSHRPVRQGILPGSLARGVWWQMHPDAAGKLYRGEAQTPAAAVAAPAKAV